MATKRKSDNIFFSKDHTKVLTNDNSVQYRQITTIKGCSKQNFFFSCVILKKKPESDLSHMFLQGP